MAWHHLEDTSPARMYSLARSTKTPNNLRGLIGEMKAFGGGQRVRRARTGGAEEAAPLDRSPTLS